MPNFPFPKPQLPDPEVELPFIWKQFFDGCDAPLTVWAEAIGPALIDALILWYQVDMIQVFRSWYKPPIFGWRLRGGPHGPGSLPEGEGGHGKRGIGKWVVDPYGAAGEAINPYDGYEMVELLPGEIWFWSGIELVATAAFYWQIFDIASAFLYKWTSGVAKSEYCAARDDAVLLAGAPGYPLLGIFGWDAIGVLNPLKQRNIFFFNGFGVGQSVGPGVVGCTFGYKNNGGGLGTPTIECRLNCLTGPRTGIYAERLVDSGVGAAGTGGCTYDMSSGEIWLAEIRVNGGWEIIEPRIFCHAVGYTGA